MSEGKRKKISLIVKSETLTELYKLVGRQQFMSGKRITITELINNILGEYVKTYKSSVEYGNHI